MGAAIVRVRTPLWWHNIYEPEVFGFAKNQITPFTIGSTDGVTLFAWHVLPLGLYEQHETAVQEQPSGVVEDITKTIGFQLLKSDPQSRLIINFHGNAGHVAQGWRTDTYRVLTADPSNSSTHVLAFDYRGFGVSSGSPTEQGLVADGVAAVKWALHVAEIPPERIVLLGHSLGTAVVAGVAHHFAVRPNAPVSLELDEKKDNGEVNEDEEVGEERRNKEKIAFAGVVLIASFTYLPALLLTYRIAPLLSILAPVRPFRFMHKLIEKIVADKWNSARRLQHYQRAVKGAQSSLSLIHALDDGNIPWAQSLNLFCDIVNAETAEYGECKATHEPKKRCEQVAEAREHKGSASYQWTELDGRNVRLDVVNYGGMLASLTGSEGMQHC
ncbi:MAG: hypothetical protein M1821_004937 [Bathelium mastoideum]|nr:MAG: hypothetical protein M1821_004937 [Bathelium mastoideum]